MARRTPSSTAQVWAASVYRYEGGWVIPRVVDVQGGLYIEIAPVVVAKTEGQLANTIKKVLGKPVPVLGIVDLDKFINERGWIARMRGTELEARRKNIKFHLDLTKNRRLAVKELRADRSGVFQEIGRPRYFARTDFNGAARFMNQKIAAAKPEPATASIPYKTGWLAIKTGSASAVARALGLRDTTAATMTQGLDAVLRGRVFVTPAGPEWVLAVGNSYLGDGTPDSVAALRRLVERLSAKFGEAQAFGTHRASEYHHWMRAREGKIRRCFASCGDTGEVLANAGRDAAENKVTKGASPEAIDEEMVFGMAAAWGVNAKAVPISPGKSGLITKPPLKSMSRPS